MANVKVYDMSGNETSTLSVSDEIFGIEPNMEVMHAMVVNYLANQRQGTQSTLTRTEVRGGGKKPWRQKGTGRARHGSSRSPIWTGGGVALGPKPRSYRYTLNKKVRRIAIKSALSLKVAQSDMLVIDGLKMDEFNTKAMIKMLNALKVDRKALIVLDSVDLKIIKSASNIPGIMTTQANTLCVYDILNHDKLIVVKDAVAKMESLFSGEGKAVEEVSA
jgi:large subunit ribosomal protein L4